MAPSTARTAKRLSRAYGFETPQALAHSLPDGAFVVDVGSGKSKFGNTIATLRPDIHWVNIDMRNGSARSMHRLQAKAPSNVQYVGGDVLKLPIAPATAQRVYTTALLPHIELTSPELAQEAFIGMAELLADEGILAYNGFSASRNSARHITAAEFHADPTGVSQLAIEQMTLNMYERQLQKASNVIGHIAHLNY